MTSGNQRRRHRSRLKIPSRTAVHVVCLLRAPPCQSEALFEGGSPNHHVNSDVESCVRSPKASACSPVVTDRMRTAGSSFCCPASSASLLSSIMLRRLVIREPYIVCDRSQSTTESCEHGLEADIGKRRPAALIIIPVYVSL